MNLGKVQCGDWGLGLWYQFSSGITSIVIEFESFFAARRAQWRVCWISMSVCGCAQPLSCHLCWKVFPTDPNTTSLWNGE